MPSLYESTVNTGEVSSSNFTTLYNASGLSVPNAGAGSVTGNLNVGGNLTVQGNSLLIGDVTLQGTLCLPNYCFPLPDGNTDQVMVTDGNGNLYWTDVSAIPGADYNISATTATGGANLTLANTAGFTDSVKFASGTNMSIVRTDANTITISTVADNIPDGTAAGQLLVWDGSAWIADNKVTSLASVDRFVAEYKDTDTARTSSGLFRRNYASTPYTTGLASTISFQFDSDSQSVATQGSLGVIYDAANPSIIGSTSIDNFTTSTRVFDINSTDIKFDGTNLVLNANGTLATAVNATITVERGTTGADATITWNETDGRWDFTNNLLATGWLGAQADVIYINWDNTAIDSYLSFKGINQEYIKWNNTDTRFEFSDQIYNSQTDIPAIFERRNVTADINSPLEFKTGLRLTQRITDAPNNDTTAAGPGITFTRTSGATATTERVFASLGAIWDGATQTVDWGFNWSNDGFTEPTPGSFPGTYTLLRMGSNDSEFYNNSIYIDYSAQGPTNTATSITGSNTLVFGSAHGYSSGDRIQYTSTTQNGLTQNAYYYVLTAGLTSTQCQLGLTSTGSAIALTNGTGLTLVFADMINQVGINTDTPNFTLDVNGEANVETTLTVPSITTLTGDDLNITAFSGQEVTISTTASADPVTIVRNTSTTNDSIRTLTLRTNSTGTPVVGFGNFLEFETETTPGTFARSGSIDNKSTGDNAGVLDEFDMTFSVMSGGTNTERMVLDNLGNLQIDGDLTVTGTNIDTGVTDTIIQIDKTSSDTAVSNRALKLLSTSTGTPTVGFGTALGFQGQTAVSTVKDAAFIAVSSTDVTPGNEDFTMAFGLMQNGAAFTNKMELNSAGDLQIDGDLAVNGDDITSTASPFNLLNQPTTVNAFTASTTTNIGSTASGTTTIGYDLVVNNDLTVDDINTDSISFPAAGAFATLKTQTTTTTLAGTPVSISGSTNVSQKATIKIVDNVTGEVHMLEALAFRSGTAGFLTTYAEMYSSVALATFTVTGTGGVTNILANPISSNSTTFNVVRLALN